MGNLPKISNHVARLSRSSFDMSQSFAFTSSTGMLLPVYYDQLNVGETVYLNGSLFARTQPLVNSAIADVDVYLDWFFVPIPLLYQLFPSIRYQTNDYFSSQFQVDVTAYGLTLPLVDITKQLNSQGSSSLSFTTTAIFNQGGLGVNFDCLGKQSFRLANHLGFNPYAIFNGITGNAYRNSTNPKVFPLMPLAYQAIFQNHYRLDNWEVHNNLCYNVDRLFDQSAYPTKDMSIADGLFQLRYRPRHLDYFMDVKVSPISSSMNLLGQGDISGAFIEPNVALEDVDNWLDGIAPNINTSQPVVNGHYYTQLTNYLAPSLTQESYDPSTYPQYQSGDPIQISTGQLRSMFAVEKLLRVIGRAKKDYDSQILAHFGYKVPHDVKHQSTKLFSQHALLHIGEVVSTSNTYDSSTNSGSTLGAISGKGYVNIPRLDKAFKFTAPVDGVVMCIYSAVPRPRYNRTFDKLNSITSRLDFFTPEFDNLGMQPLFKYEAYANEVGISSERIGWQLRYMQHKVKYDRASEAFNYLNNVNNPNTNTYSSWVLSRADVYPYATIQPGGFLLPGINDLYCSPKELDSIMVVKYDTRWSSSYEVYPYLMFGTDPFINDFNASVKKVSTMSPSGEPGFMYQD